MYKGRLLGKPWFTEDLFDLTRKKQRFYFKYKKTGLERDYKRYKEFRHLVAKSVLVAKRGYSQRMTDDDYKSKNAIMFSDDLSKLILFPFHPIRA